MWIGIGLAGMFLISRIDYHTLMDQAPALYLVGVAGLLVVLADRIFPPRSQALDLARRLMNLQVSELMKLIIIIVLARYFAEVRTDRLTLTDLLKIGILTLIPVGLILKQPDLGTAMVLVPVAVVGAFLAGIEWKHAAIGLVIIALLVPLGWNMRQASEAVPAAAHSDVSCIRRKTSAARATRFCNPRSPLAPEDSGEKDSARAARTNWALCPSGIRTSFWRRWLRNKVSLAFVSFCCCTWA